MSTRRKRRDVGERIVWVLTASILTFLLFCGMVREIVSWKD